MGRQPSLVIKDVEGQTWRQVEMGVVILVGVVLPRGTVQIGELLGWFADVAREAMRKDYGVLMAMPLGQSRAPPSSNESQ